MWPERNIQLQRTKIKKPRKSKQTAKIYVSEPTLQTRRKPARTGRWIHSSNVHPNRNNRRIGATSQREHPNLGGECVRNICDMSHRKKPSIRAGEEKVDKG